MLKHWYTLRDLEENQQELLEISAIFSQDLYKIIERNPKTWIEKIDQVLLLEELTKKFERGFDISFLVDKTMPLTRIAIEKLSVVPPSANDFNLISYISRGTKEATTYNFLTGTFHPLKITDVVLKWSCITQISNTELFITGGKPAKDVGAVWTFSLFDIESEDTKEMPKMISAHSSHVALLHENKFYVISGKNDANVVTTLCEVFDLQSHIWTSIANILQGRTCASGAVLKNQIYIIGGCKNNTIEKYDIESNVWNNLLVTLPDYKWQHSSVLVGENILIFGGQGINEEPSRNSFFFNPCTLEFTDFKEMPVKNSWISGWYPIVQRGNCIWLMNKECKLLCFNTTTKQWSLFINKISS